MKLDQHVVARSLWDQMKGLRKVERIRFVAGLVVVSLVMGERLVTMS